MAEVLDFQTERSRRKREARQDRAIAAALARVKQAFPDIGASSSAADLVALTELAFETLIGHPDFPELAGAAVTVSTAAGAEAPHASAPAAPPHAHARTA